MVIGSGFPEAGNVLPSQDVLLPTSQPKDSLVCDERAASDLNDSILQFNALPSRHPEFQSGDRAQGRGDDGWGHRDGWVEVCRGAGGDGSRVAANMQMSGSTGRVISRASASPNAELDGFLNQMDGFQPSPGLSMPSAWLAADESARDRKLTNARVEGDSAIISGGMGMGMGMEMGMGMAKRNGGRSRGGVRGSAGGEQEGRSGVQRLKGESERVPPTAASSRVPASVLSSQERLERIRNLSNEHKKLHKVVGRLKVGKQALEGELRRLTEEVEGRRREGVGDEVAHAIDLLSRALVEGKLPVASPRFQHLLALATSSHGDHTPSRPHRSWAGMRGGVPAQGALKPRKGQVGHSSQCLEALPLLEARGGVEERFWFEGATGSGEKNAMTGVGGNTEERWQMDGGWRVQGLGAVSGVTSGGAYSEYETLKRRLGSEVGCGVGKKRLLGEEQGWEGQKTGLVAAQVAQSQPQNLRESMPAVPLPAPHAPWQGQGWGLDGWEQFGAGRNGMAEEGWGGGQSLHSTGEGGGHERRGRYGMEGGGEGEGVSGRYLTPPPPPHFISERDAYGGVGMGAQSPLLISPGALGQEAMPHSYPQHEEWSHPFGWGQPCHPRMAMGWVQQRQVHGYGQGGDGDAAACMREEMRLAGRVGM